MEDDAMAVREQAAMPRSLQDGIKRFGGSRRNVRLTLSSGSTTVNENGILRIRLPSNSLCDLRGFGFSGDLTTTGGTAGASGVMGSHTLIRRISMTAAGVVTNAQNNNWNLTAHCANLAGNGLEFDKGNLLNGGYPLDMVRTSEFLEFNYFPYSPLTCGIIDTGLTGEVEIEIVFAGAEALVTDQGSTPQTAYSIANLRAYVPVIDLETDFYRKFVAAALARGKTIQKQMELATAVVQGAQSSNSFNVSTACLDKVLVAPKDAAWQTAAAQADGQVYSRYLDVDCGAAHPADGYSVYVQIGSYSFPAFGFGDNYAQLAELTRQNWAGSVYNYNKLFLQTDGSGAALDTANLEYKAQAYCEHNAVVLIPVGAFDEHGKEGGIDLSSGNSIIRVECKGTNLESSAQTHLLMAGIHKSKLQIRAGQTVSFSV